MSVAVFEVTGKLAIGLLHSMLASECGDVLLVWVGCIITHHPATCSQLEPTPAALPDGFGQQLWQSLVSFRAVGSLDCAAVCSAD